MHPKYPAHAFQDDSFILIQSHSKSSSLILTLACDQPAAVAAPFVPKTGFMYYLEVMASVCVLG